MLGAPLLRNFEVRTRDSMSIPRLTVIIVASALRYDRPRNPSRIGKPEILKSEILWWTAIKRDDCLIFALIKEIYRKEDAWDRCLSGFQELATPSRHYLNL